MNQTVWKLDGECQLGFAHWDRLFEPLSLLEVTIGLSRGDRTVLCQPLDRIGQFAVLPKQVASAVETLGFLGIVSASRMSYISNLL